MHIIFKEAHHKYTSHDLHDQQDASIQFLNEYIVRNVWSNMRICGSYQVQFYMACCIEMYFLMAVVYWALIAWIFIVLLFILQITILYC